MNYVAVDDIARALVLVCENPGSSGTFILNESIPLPQVVETVASALGAPAPTLRLPLSLGLALGELGSVAERVLRRNLPVDRERIQELTNNTRYDGSALQRATGFQYESGARPTLASMATSYSLAGLL
jgi:nucleoside-diphosphate-sugar epimerase